MASELGWQSSTVSWMPFDIFTNRRAQPVSTTSKNQKINATHSRLTEHVNQLQQQHILIESPFQTATRNHVCR
jgi:hypothetical protein